MSTITYSSGAFTTSSAISSSVEKFRKAMHAQFSSKRAPVDSFAWLTDVTLDSSYASEFDLHRFAKQRVAGLRAAGDYLESTVTKDRLGQILGNLVEDGGPTPQVGATADRSIEVQWLCGGTLLAAIIEHDGEVSLIAEDATSRPIFDFEFDQDEPISPAAFDQARNLLREMAAGVKKRPFDWHLTR
ncbi:hypothetical protein [Microbacterium sp. NPDC086615]|uniref:hypothetical protein n=1 Tax=Microbacterium sp. NPDC086615 TaxID=3154865 RepID=UPI003421DEB2